MNCTQAGTVIAREGGGRSTAADRSALSEHLRECESCRRAWDDQRLVAAVLASRVDAPVAVGFADRVMQRLDASADWLSLADWRRWALRLVPVAAALAIVALLLPPGGSSVEGSLQEVVETFALGPGEAELPVTSLFWQSDVDSDLLLQAALTGTSAGLSGVER